MDMGFICRLPRCISGLSQDSDRVALSDLVADGHIIFTSRTVRCNGAA